jgi:hypothetical protein
MTMSGAPVEFRHVSKFYGAWQAADAHGAVHD